MSTTENYYRRYINDLTQEGFKLQVDIEMLDVGISSNSIDQVYDISARYIDLTRYDGIVGMYFEIGVWDYYHNFYFLNDPGIGSSCQIWLLDPDDLVVATITTTGSNGGFLDPETLTSGSFIPTKSGLYKLKVQSDDTISRGVNISCARMRIRQENATKTRIPVAYLINDLDRNTDGGMAASTLSAINVSSFISTGYQNPAGTGNDKNYGIWCRYDEHFSDIVQFTLDIISSTSTSINNGGGCLFNRTLDTQIAASEILFTGLTPTFHSLNIAKDAINFIDEQDIEFRGKIDSGNSFFQACMLWIELENLSKVRLTHRLQGQLDVSSETFCQYSFEYVPNKYTNSKIYFEGISLCSTLNTTHNIYVYGNGINKYVSPADAIAYSFQFEHFRLPPAGRVTDSKLTCNITTKQLMLSDQIQLTDSTRYIVDIERSMGTGIIRLNQASIVLNLES